MRVVARPKSGRRCVVRIDAINSQAAMVRRIAGAASAPAARISAARAPAWRRT
jgi:hypothetical protein